MFIMCRCLCFLMCFVCLVSGCKQSHEENPEALVSLVNEAFGIKIIPSRLNKLRVEDLGSWRFRQIWIQLELSPVELSAFLSSSNDALILLQTEGYWGRQGVKGIEWWTGDVGENQRFSGVTSPWSDGQLGSLRLTVSTLPSGNSVIHISAIFPSRGQMQQPMAAGERGR